MSICYWAKNVTEAEVVNRSVGLLILKQTSTKIKLKAPGIELKSNLIIKTDKRSN